MMNLFKRFYSYALLTAIFVFAASAARAQSYYVATNGSDSNSGSQAAPFLTLARAQKAMQSSSIKTTQIQSGIYYLTSPLALTEADNGETWKAASGANVVLSGGEVLTGWQSKGNGVYTTHAPQPVGVDLAINGVRQTAAAAGYDPARPFTTGWRMVDPSQPTTTGTTIKMLAADLASPSVKPGATAQLLGDNRYSDNFTTIASVNKTNNTVTFANGFYNHAAGGSINGHAASWRVLADPADLSVAGQFAYDKSSGTVYVKPQSGTNMSQSTVTAAQMLSLITLTNVSGVTISGIMFTDTTSSPNAYANELNVRSASLVVINSSGCTFSGNTFLNAGNGIGLKNSPNNKLTGNTFQDMGGIGILLLSGSNSNTVSKNVMTRVGRVNIGSMGVHVADSSSNVIDSNTIDGSPRFAIDLLPSDNVQTRKNVVSNNIIRNTGQQTNDVGAIYAWAPNGLGYVDLQLTVTGNRVENTGGLTRDANGNFVQGWSEGIYMDDHASGATITKNVVEGSGLTGIFLCHGCSGNSADNNVVVMRPMAVYSRGSYGSFAPTTDMTYNGTMTFDLLPSYFPNGVNTSTIVVQLSGTPAADGSPAHFVVSADGVWIGAGYATNAVSSYVFKAALAPHTHHIVKVRLDNGADTGTATRQLHNIGLFVNNTPITPYLHTVNFHLVQNDDLNVTNFSVTRSINYRTNGPAQDLTSAVPAGYVDTNPGVIDNNLVHSGQSRLNTGDPTFGKQAVDANSMNGDPLFTNPGIGDYSLKSNSPALALGFTTAGVPLKP
jgi:parallel beta-helix repeat protein